MFQTPYVHILEDYIVHATLYGTFPCIEASILPSWILHVRYSLSDDERKMFETRTRTELKH